MTRRAMILVSKKPEVMRIARALEKRPEVDLEHCELMGGHYAWSRFLNTGTISLLNTGRLAKAIGCPLRELLEG